MCRRRKAVGEPRNLLFGGFKVKFKSKGVVLKNHVLVQKGFSVTLVSWTFKGREARLLNVLPVEAFHPFLSCHQTA